MYAMHSIKKKRKRKYVEIALETNFYAFNAQRKAAGENSSASDVNDAKKNDFKKR